AARLGSDHSDALRGTPGYPDHWRFRAGFRGEPVGGPQCVQKTRRPRSFNKLNSEINAGLADPKLKARFADLGGMVLPGSVADFGKLIADDTEKWGKVVKFSGAKPG